MPAIGTLLHRSPVERALMTLQEIAKGLPADPQPPPATQKVSSMPEAAQALAEKRPLAALADLEQAQEPRRTGGVAELSLIDLELVPETPNSVPQPLLSYVAEPDLEPEPEPEPEAEPQPHAELQAELAATGTDTEQASELDRARAGAKARARAKAMP